MATPQQDSRGLFRGFLLAESRYAEGLEVPAAAGLRGRTADGSVEVRAGDRRPWIRHAEEQRIVERIQQRRGAGLGSVRISRELEQAGIVSPRTGECRWTRVRVEKILASVERRAKAAG